jgi:hypothetical protein
MSSRNPTRFSKLAHVLVVSLVFGTVSATSTILTASKADAQYYYYRRAPAPVIRYQVPRYIRPWPYPVYRIPGTIGQYTPCVYGRRIYGC